MGIDYSEDPAYANQKLTGSLVRLDGVPVLINEVGGSKVSYVKAGTNSRANICELSDLDLSPIPLGYINYDNRCMFSRRAPARRYKQGLTNNTFLREDGNYLRVHDRDNLHMYLGQYPNLKHCFESIYEGECLSKAFCRDFCVGEKELIGNSLKYKGLTIGTVSYNKGFTYKLNEEYEFLDELLQENINA